MRKGATVLPFGTRRRPSSRRTRWRPCRQGPLAESTLADHGAARRRMAKRRAHLRAHRRVPHALRAPRPPLGRRRDRGRRVPRRRANAGLLRLCEEGAAGRRPCPRPRARRRWSRGEFSRIAVDRGESRTLRDMSHRPRRTPTALAARLDAYAKKERLSNRASAAQIGVDHTTIGVWRKSRRGAKHGLQRKALEEFLHEEGEALMLRPTRTQKDAQPAPKPSSTPSICAGPPRHLLHAGSRAQAEQGDRDRSEEGGALGGARERGVREERRGRGRPSFRASNDPRRAVSEPVATKRCPVCAQDLPATPRHFRQRSDVKASEFRAECICCERAIKNARRGREMKPCCRCARPIIKTRRSPLCRFCIYAINTNWNAQPREVFSARCRAGAQKRMERARVVRVAKTSTTSCTYCAETARSSPSTSRGS